MTALRTFNTEIHHLSVSNDMSFDGWHRLTEQMGTVVAQLDSTRRGRKILKALDSIILDARIDDEFAYFQDDLGELKIPFEAPKDFYIKFAGRKLLKAAAIGTAMVGALFVARAAWSRFVEANPDPEDLTDTADNIADHAETAVEVVKAIGAMSFGDFVLRALR